MSRLQKIRKILRSGYAGTRKSLADKFDVSPSLVTWAARQEGLVQAASPRLDEMEKLRVLQMHRAGHFVPEIAAQIGVSDHAVRDLLIKNGLPTRSFTEAEILRKAVALATKGNTYSEVAERLNITRNQVAGAVFRAKRKA